MLVKFRFLPVVLLACLATSTACTSGGGKSGKGPKPVAPQPSNPPRKGQDPSSPSPTQPVAQPPGFGPNERGCSPLLGCGELDGVWTADAFAGRCVVTYNFRSQLATVEMACRDGRYLLRETHDSSYTADGGEVTFRFYWSDCRDYPLRTVTETYAFNADKTKLTIGNLTLGKANANNAQPSLSDADLTSVSGCFDFGNIRTFTSKY